MPSQGLKWLRSGGLAASVLLAACGTPASTKRGAPGRYAQTTDSATSACLRNPACYTKAPGEEAVIPWLSRSADAARTTAAVMRLLEAAEIARVDKALTECAQQANFEVNERRLGPGKSPTRKQCQEVVGQDAQGNDVTRAMALGTEKHEVALDCARKELRKLFPENVSLELRYKLDSQTGRWRPLDPQRVEAWLREGLFSLLLGTLVPDVVLHASGDPARVQAVYDFKFPCPADRYPSWREYPKGHPHHPAHQGDMYRKALGGEESPGLVTPQLGVVR